MADQIQVQHSASGANLYALVRNSEGLVWDGADFVPYATADLATYALAMTEQGVASAFYTCDFPIVPVGLYTVTVFVGASPAEGDTPVTSQSLEWSEDEQRFGVSLPVFSIFATTNQIASKIGSPADDLTQDIAGVLTAVGDLDGGITLVHRFFRLLLRADAAIATDLQAELDALNADGGSGAGSYDNTTDSLQAQSARTPTLVSGRVPADAEAISGSTTAADKLESHAGAVTQVIIGTGSTTTSVVLHASTGVDGGAPPSGADVFNGRVLVITSGTLNRQAKPIDDYDGSTGTLTIGDGGFTGSAANGVTGVIV